MQVKIKTESFYLSYLHYFTCVKGLNFVCIYVITSDHALKSEDMNAENVLEYMHDKQEIVNYLTSGLIRQYSLTCVQWPLKSQVISILID